MNWATPTDRGFARLPIQQPGGSCAAVVVAEKWHPPACTWHSPRPCCVLQTVRLAVLKLSRRRSEPGTGHAVQCSAVHSLAPDHQSAAAPQRPCRNLHASPPGAATGRPACRYRHALLCQHPGVRACRELEPGNTGSCVLCATARGRPLHARAATCQAMRAWQGCTRHNGGTRTIRGQPAQLAHAIIAASNAAITTRL